MAGEERIIPSTVVLIHGLVGSSLSMVPLANDLAMEMPVIAPDLPGFGRSDKTDYLNIPELADAMYDWSRVLALNNILFVGHEFGCQVIADLLARYSLPVAGVMMIAPSLDPRILDGRTQFTRMLKDLPRERLFKLTGVYLSDYWRAGWLRVAATLRFAKRDSMDAKLPKVNVPTLVLRGSNDPIVSQEWAAHVTKQLPNATLEIIEGPHALHFSRPFEVAERIRMFREQLATPNH